MTAQTGEWLIYKGEQTWMRSEPFNPWLKAHKFPVTPNSTACARGYFGRWEIKDDKLYLIGLKVFVTGYFRQREEIDMARIFPGQKEVFAEWYSGEIRIPVGERLEYVHSGYASTYEKDIILQFEKGIQTSEEVVDNTIGFVPRNQRRSS